MMRFKVGKVVIHPSHGACTVEKILANKLVLTSYIKGINALTIIIPLRSLTQIKLRPLSSKKTIYGALENLKKKIDLKKLKHSHEEIKDQFIEGDFNGLCQTAAELYIKIYTDGDERTSQMKLLDGAINLMAEEVGVVQHIKKEEAKKGILTRLQEVFGP